VYIKFASDLDKDNECVPITYAIVDEKSKDNWCNFLRCLREVIGDNLQGEHAFVALLL